MADGVSIRDCAHLPRIELVAAERVVSLCLWADRGLSVTVYAARVPARIRGGRYGASGRPGELWGRLWRRLRGRLWGRLWG
eukprot:scaffold121062_cov48-Phaeocystis_antarctica.AAC.2